MNSASSADNSAQSPALSDDVSQDLTVLREEEKLARDVYSTLYDKWGATPFVNISDSEQRHTDSVASLLDRYRLRDPVHNDAIGVFTNTTFQHLYAELIDRGSQSLLAAFEVGATIEELDISDILEMQRHEAPFDVDRVYESLRCGSRNHLRTFVARIEGEGGSFDPQYLTPEDVTAITQSSHEMCGQP